jgi:hypothetical protein
VAGSADFDGLSVGVADGVGAAADADADARAEAAADADADARAEAAALADADGATDETDADGLVEPQPATIAATASASSVRAVVVLIG